MMGVLIDYTDPGWRRAIGFGLLFPVVVVWAPRLRRRSEHLTELRAYCVGFCLIVPLFYLAFSLTPILWDSGHRDWLALLVMAIGVLNLRVLRGVRRKPLVVSSEERLIQSYRLISLISLSYAMAPVLWAALATVFLTGSLWLYLVGAPFTAIGLVWAAPTQADIAYRQGQLTERGSRLSLGRALVGEPQIDQ
jgi:hypothetical protein